MLKSGPFWGVLILFGLMYALFTGYDNPVITTLWGPASGVATLFLLRLSAPDEEQDRTTTASLLAAAGSVVLGTLLKAVLVGRASSLWDSAAVVLSVAAVRATVLVMAATRANPCFLCKNALGSGTTLACPRCGQQVCNRPSCWSARHLRCTKCLEKEVVIFPTRDQWWSVQFGPRVSRGVCDVCMAESHEKPLHACGQCVGVMCRRCWDLHNGQCERCGWHVPDIPRALARLMMRSRQPLKG